MNNNIRVRAIINIDNGIVLIHRKRAVDGEMREYYPLPGGGIEEQESLEEALYREIKEELGIVVKINKQIYKIIDDISVQHIFLCDYVSGEFGTGNGPEFNDSDYQKRGEYIPEVINLRDLKNTNMVPAELKEQLLKDLENNELKNINFSEINIVKIIII